MSGKPPVRAFVAAGANLEPRTHILRALDLLAEETAVLGISTFYRTRPLERPEQPDFLNGAFLLETTLPPEELKFSLLREIERALGRVRGPDPHEARPIDLDLVLYGEAVLRREGLVLPDPEITRRPFLAIPLLDLDPGLLLPGRGAALKDLVPPGWREELEPDEKFTRTLRGRLMR